MSSTTPVRRNSDDFLAKQERRRSGNFSAMTPRSAGSSTSNLLESTPVRPRVSLSRTPSGATPRRASNWRAKAPELNAWLQILRNNKKMAESEIWNCDLITYFDLGSVSVDGHVNFQQASLFLNGATKLYGSRVENVNTMSRRLLNTLQNQGADPQLEREDDEDEGSAEPEVARPKKAKRDPKIIVKNPAVLQLKESELTNTIDIQFRKMQEDYDKGGIKGLLMNRLVPDKFGRLTFEDIPEGPVDLNGDDQVTEEQDQQAEMTGFKSVDLDKYADLFRASGDVLCPRIDEIQRAIDDPDALESDDEPEDDSGPGADADRMLDAYDEYAGDISQGIHDINNPEDEAGDLNMSDAELDEEMDPLDIERAAEDATVVHWKTRRFKETRALEEMQDQPRPQERRRKDPAEDAFDFNSDPVDVDAMFAPFKMRSSGKLTAEKLKPVVRLRSENKNLKFMSRYFCNPSLTPKVICNALLPLHLRNKRTDPDNLQSSEEDLADTTVDVEMADMGAFHDGLDVEALEQQQQDDLLPASLEDVTSDAALDFESDPLSMTGGGLVRSGRVRFAIAPRKVDIHRLKENMWHSVEKLFDEVDKVDPEPEEVVKLTEVMYTTKPNYTSKEQVDLVPPLYFLNMLHLANEEGLDLIAADHFHDVLIKRRRFE